MGSVSRGEVWLIDLGFAAKVRPCLILSVPLQENDRVLCAIVPHTTSLRGSVYEVAIAKSFLKPGAFNAQAIQSIAQAHLIRRIGTLERDELNKVSDAVSQWLGMNAT